MRVLLFLFIAIFLDAKTIDFSSLGLGVSAEVAELSESVDSKAELTYVNDELLNKSDTSHNHDDLYEPKNGNIQEHISNKSNPHEITKAQIGLLNVDNTRDLNKPTSTATQEKLDLKLNISDLPKPNKIYTYNYSSTKTFGSGNAIVLFTTDSYVIREGRDIEVEVSLPLRSTGTNWGGAYINWNLNVNGTWYNLGNTGYDGNVMVYSGKSIATYRHKQVLRLISNLGLDGDYTVQLEVTARSYNETIYLNGLHDINRVANGLDSRGSVATWAKNLNFATTYIREVSSEL